MAYPEKNNPSNPDAVPLYISNTLEFWKWFNDVWECNDWITWHKAMIKKYGKEKADQTFLYHWNKLGFITSTADCRSFNTAFRTYMKQQGLLDQLYKGLAVIAKPFGVGTDVVTSVGSGLSSVGTVIKFALPILAVLIVIGGIVYAMKYVKK